VRLGQKGGTEAETLAVNQMPAHTHTPACFQNPGNSGTPVDHVWAGDSTGGFTADYSTAATNNTMNPAAVAETGGGQGHTNLPPYGVLSFAIALQGLFPSR
jgi:microcystin-dependent protein